MFYNLSEYLLDYSINSVYLPPVVLGQLPKREYPSLLSLAYAGEPCDKQVAEIWSSKTKLYNYYGPTEGSISTIKQILRSEVEQIGTPIPNTKAYVLDTNKRPVSIGIIGELYVGGSGVARGYLNRPDLTNERFIENPFSSESDKSNGYTRIYKTGDLVRWLTDGNLEYIGRNDDQVKIRGYRIELGEIEHALTEIDGIVQGCVISKERETESGTSKYLVGYYVLDTTITGVTESIILAKLSKVLPDYMVPSALVEMESFPLTINGKLDKKSLPDVDFSSSDKEYVAPTTEIEIALCSIWEEVLGVERVGITDNFFRIGGHSLKAVKLTNEINKVYNIALKINNLFKAPTIAEFAHLIEIFDNNFDKTEGIEEITL